jgi:antirestriction protein
MMTTTETPRVWVGCLGCYNGGHLVGEWFDATDAPEEMDEFSPRVFGASGPFGQAPEGHAEEMHEELWVFDHEGFHGLLTGECSPSEAKELAEQLERSDNPAAFAVYVADHLGRHYAAKDWDAARESFEEAFCGVYESEKDYAYELADEMGFEAPDAWPAMYIDWDAATRDLFMGDYFSAPALDYNVFIFRAI